MTKPMEIFSIKTIFTCIIVLYLLSLSIIFFSQQSPFDQTQRGLHSLRVEDDGHEEVSRPEEDYEPKIYRFSNPMLAYKILTQLEVPPRPHNVDTAAKVPFLNLKLDEDYCDKHRQYITQFPETIFQKLNFITDAGPLNMIRNLALSQIGNDVQPNIGGHIPRTTPLVDIKPEVNLFFTRDDMYSQKRIGKHFSCLTQMSNTVLGRQVLGAKSLFAEEAKKYARKYDGRPECFDLNKYYPQSYLLYRKQECQDFFKVFNSPEYQALKAERGIVYIKKLSANLHSGKGVEPVQEPQETFLRNFYKNGSLCGQIDDKYILQTYIYNPLLLHGRKFDFRIYLMLASVNPLIAHYHDGFLRVSLLPYDVNSSDKKVLLTNLGLNYQIYGNAKDGVLFEGMNEEQLRHAQQWSYERLQAYLLETGHITDPNWLDNYLRPTIKRAMVHLLRISLIDMYEHSSLFQIYGVDFMLDNDLNLWFIEANSQPGLGEYSQPMQKFITKMLIDHIEVATGLLRSRMKRIVNYVNMLIEEKAYDDLGRGEIAVRDLEYRRLAFQHISKNWFEKEFEPSPTNGYQKIIDENYIGIERYQGLLEQECL